MSLNETEVQKQLKHMQEFIALEAQEKCEEIDLKAEEEFQIEKSRLVQNQRIKIMEFYTKKEKQLELAKKIQDSNLMNQSRIKVLQSREEHIQLLLQEAKKRLVEKSKDHISYKNTLVGLITQGLYQLLEKEVILRCVKRDHDLVKEALKPALEQYKSETGESVAVKIDEDRWLPDSISGGVELTTGAGKITVVNTLESRLDQISEHLMPQIREILFGTNPNRKFND